MKRILMTSLIPVLMAGAFGAGAAPKPVTVTGGKITFTGEVVAAPCVVDETSTSVNLGQVPTNRLNAKGVTSSAVPFTIRLVGCSLASPDAADPAKADAYTGASVTFNGITAGDSQTLALTPGTSAGGDPAAQNVGIQILQGGKAVNVDGSTASAKQALRAGSNDIPFSAVYVATADGVVAGPANASASFMVNYD